MSFCIFFKVAEVASKLNKAVQCASYFPPIFPLHFDYKEKKTAPENESLTEEVMQNTPAELQGQGIRKKSVKFLLARYVEKGQNMEASNGEENAMQAPLSAV